MPLRKNLNPLPATSSAKASLPKPKLPPRRAPNFSLFTELQKLGYKRIVGLDEVGRGALAGPIVVTAIELPIKIIGINDSKLLTRRKREELATVIKKNALQQQFGSASCQEIDQLGATKALALAYQRALLGIEADLFLTDFVYLPGGKYIRAIKGDSLFYPVAAASIVAKVYRDNIMRQLHPEFEPYDWDNNVGYGTAHHLDAIQKYGPTVHHRTSFLSKK